MHLFKKLTNINSTNGFSQIWVVSLIVVIDHFSKAWMLQHLKFHEPIKILSTFNLTLYFNTGAAFGFLHTASGWQNFLLAGIELVVSFSLILWLANTSSRKYWRNSALYLILGGAIGNFIDRVFYGHVIDFLSFHVGDWYFAIFNIADCAICLGAFMFFLHSMYYRKKFIIRY